MSDPFRSPVEAAKVRVAVLEGEAAKLRLENRIAELESERERHEASIAPAGVPSAGATFWAGLVPLAIGATAMVAALSSDAGPWLWLAPIVVGATFVAGFAALPIVRSIAQRRSSKDNEKIVARIEKIDEQISDLRQPHLHDPAAFDESGSEAPTLDELHRRIEELESEVATRSAAPRGRAHHDD